MSTCFELWNAAFDGEAGRCKHSCCIRHLASAAAKVPHRPPRHAAAMQRTCWPRLLPPAPASTRSRQRRCAQRAGACSGRPRGRWPPARRLLPALHPRAPLWMRLLQSRPAPARRMPLQAFQRCECWLHCCFDTPCSPACSHRSVCIELSCCFLRTQVAGRLHDRQHSGHGWRRVDTLLLPAC